MLKKDRKPTIKFIRELGEQSLSHEQMAERLNQRGVMPRPGRLWTQSAVSQFCHYWAVFKKTDRRRRKLELYDASTSEPATKKINKTDELALAELVLASSLNSDVKKQVLKGLFK